MTGERPRTVFFDLDGTLLDTAPDLAFALNSVRARHGRSKLPLQTIRAYASQGSPGLLRLGFDVEPDDPAAGPLKEQILAVYEQNSVTLTRIFPGMEAVLDALDERSIAWGIVTNKLAYLTDHIVAAMGLDERAVCVVSGDTAPRSKPFPDPLLFAADRAACPPHRCVYLGDDMRDVQAGNSAGMLTLVALFGYLGPDARPRSWGADGYINQPGQLLDWV